MIKCGYNVASVRLKAKAIANRKQQREKKRTGFPDCRGVGRVERAMLRYVGWELALSQEYPVVLMA